MKKVTASILAGAAAALVCALPAVAADKPVATQERGVWPAETISGTIGTVEASQKIVVVRSAKVPFDMVVTPRTRITAGDHKITLEDLSKYQNKNVSVRFIPEGRGDIAQSIQING